MGNSEGNMNKGSEGLKGKEISTGQNNIFLMGDSVLDNFYWLDNPKLDLAQQLRLIYGQKYEVHNLAVDESETKDILNGMIPSGAYSSGRKQNGMEGYPVAEDKKVYPLKLLEVLKSQEGRNLAVISVGGNDARVCLGTLIQGGDHETIYEQMNKKGFEVNYEKIIEKTKAITQEIVLVLVYMPHEGYFPEFRGHFNKLMEIVKKFIFIKARKNRLPVIDLSRTFDPKNRKHYGSTEIEPSNDSSEFIAKLIQKVAEDYDFTKDESKIYYGYGDKITIDSNKESNELL